MVVAVVAERGGGGGRDLEGGGMAAVARLGNVRQFGLRELQAATDGFSARHILGKGGFGNVYRGRLADGTTVAVKRLNDPASASGEAQFRTEVEMISLAVHRHLLRLVGFCAAGGERLLVYPYMPNGSVASRLRGTQPASRHVTRAVTVLLLPAFVHRRIARCPPEGGPEEEVRLVSGASRFVPR
jgi:hypothetical protein